MEVMKQQIHSKYMDIVIVFQEMHPKIIKTLSTHIKMLHTTVITGDNSANDH